MGALNEIDFVAHVGIDWADKKHDACIQEANSEQREFVVIPHKCSGIVNLAPRLLVAFGEDRERYQNAAELQKSAAVAPVTERSGNKHWVHWRWKCSTFLRQTFIEWA